MAEQLKLPQDKLMIKTVYMTGYLQKRQRGKHIKRETQRMKLKFQERFCELNEDNFIYSKKKNVSTSGTTSYSLARPQALSSAACMPCR